MQTRHGMLPLVTLLAAAVLQPALAGTWGIVLIDDAQIAVPNTWLTLEVAGPNIRLYRIGSGIEVPELDESGEPLQLGLLVETPPSRQQSLEQVANDLAEAAKHARNLELLKTLREPITLADGTRAVLLTLEFIKEGSRRSLQLKLVTRDAKGTTWIVSGFLVGGLDSQWPRPQSEIAQWLRGIVTWITFDSKGLRPPPGDLKKQ